MARADVDHVLKNDQILFKFFLFFPSPGHLRRFRIHVSCSATCGSFVNGDDTPFSRGQTTFVSRDVLLNTKATVAELEPDDSRIETALPKRRKNKKVNVTMTSYRVPRGSKKDR